MSTRRPFTDYKQENIVVATPMRSGTHVLIDLLLNNVSDYRRKPLYVDLAGCLQRKNLHKNYLDQICDGGGHIVKTHLPIKVAKDRIQDPRIETLFRNAVVITVKRDTDSILDSLERWNAFEGDAYRQNCNAMIKEFWNFWQDRPHTSIAFRDLFDAQEMEQIISDICEQTGSEMVRPIRGPSDPAKKSKIYFNKAATRLLGKFAPKIDTTIHTLK